MVQGRVEGWRGAAGVPLRYHGTRGEGGDVSLGRRRGGGVLRDLHVESGGVRRGQWGRVGGLLEVALEAAETSRSQTGQLRHGAGAVEPAAKHPGSFGAGLR